METRTLGSLRTSIVWENRLDELPAKAGGDEGLGFMWRQQKAPAREWMDPTIHEGWRLAVVRGVRFTIPRGTEIIEVPASQSKNHTAYRLVKIGQIVVHLRDGLNFHDGTLVANAHVCARIIWPDGAEKRKPNGANWQWRNYYLFLDLHPTTKEEVSAILEVYPEGSKRSKAIMLGVTDTLYPPKGEAGDPVEGVVWATKSADWKPAMRGNPSTGCDQLIFFVPVKN